MIPSRALFATVFGAVLATAGCSAGQEDPGSPFDGSRGAEDVLLTVENNDFRDATIHVFWNGMRTRAGMVTGKTSETFRLDWRGEFAQLQVDFIGSGGPGARGDYTSERVSVYPGDHLNFVILPGM